MRQSYLKVLAVAYLVLASPWLFCSPIRRALVIGNDSYPGNALRNARNDARAMASGLDALGYVATLALDLTRRSMNDVINRFTESVSPGDTVIIYYAGHGLEVEGRNYLVPIDFAVGDEAEVKFQGYALGQLLGKLTEHGVVTQIVILDSCRDNPFKGTRSMGGGWASIGASAGTFVAFGTAPGSTSSDDPNSDHGLFTQSLLNHLDMPIELEQVFQLVRMDVVKSSHGSQVPWTSSSLIGTFHINPREDNNALPLPDLSSGNSDVTMEDNPRSYVSSIKSNVSNKALFSSVLGNESALIGEALLQTRSLHFSQAIPILQEILSLDPRCSIALRLLGLALHLTGRSLEGSAILDKAIAIDPTDGIAHSYRCLIGSQEVVSEEHCKRALELRTDLPQAQLGLSISLKLKRLRDDATLGVGLSTALAAGSAPESDHANANIKPSK